MDPVAHTLVGASLAEAGLKAKTRLATPILLIGANLPDIDAVAGILGRDASLMHRRGWTHGVLAMVVLPLLLTAGMALWARRRPARDEPAFDPRWALGLACIGVWSHPLLDWLNTYGVRLLMPFDGRWFYGDGVFIVDPWIWLLAAAAVVLARSGGRLSVAAWCLLGSAASAMVLGFATVPLLAKIVWLVGVGAIVGARLRFGLRSAPRLAAACVTLIGIYAASMVGGSAWARQEARAALEAKGVKVSAVMSGPVPANPLLREGVAVGAERYHMFDLDPLRETPVALKPGPKVAPEEAAIVERALAAPEVQGFRNWMRFPYFEVQREGSGWVVLIRDLRYATPTQTRGFGITQVRLPR